MSKSVSRLIDNLEDKLVIAMANLENCYREAAEIEETILSLNKSIDELKELQDDKVK